MLTLLMQDWLTKNKELDLNFCKIHNWPLRPNWMQSILQLQLARWDLPRLGVRKQWKLFKYRQAMKNLTKGLFFGPHLFACAKKRKLIVWNLFITPSKSWNVASWWRENEARLQPWYYSRIIDFIKEHYEEMVASYANWVKEMFYPKAVLPYCHPEKRLDAMQEQPVEILEFDGELPSIPDSLYYHAKDCLKVSLEEEIKGLSQMPDLEPEGENVRGAEPIIPAPENPHPWDDERRNNYAS